MRAGGEQPREHPVVPETSGSRPAQSKRGRPSASELARWVLSSYLATFMLARCLVYLMITDRISDLYLFVGQTHVHHLNYGIFLLAIVGGLLLFQHLGRRGLFAVALVYGIGLGLTFDEFGMWLHLGGGYWQRISFDAVAVVGGMLGLISAAPRLMAFRARHWAVIACLAVVLGALVWVSVDLMNRRQRRLEPRMERLDPITP